MVVLLVHHDVRPQVTDGEAVPGDRRGVGEDSVEVARVSLGLHVALASAGRAAVPVRVVCGVAVEVLRDRLAEDGQLVRSALGEVLQHRLVDVAVVGEGPVGGEAGGRSRTGVGRADGVPGLDRGRQARTEVTAEVAAAAEGLEAAVPAGRGEPDLDQLPVTGRPVGEGHVHLAIGRDAGDRRGRFGRSGLGRVGQGAARLRYGTDRHDPCVRGWHEVGCHTVVGHSRGLLGYGGAGVHRRQRSGQRQSGGYQQQSLHRLSSSWARSVRAYEETSGTGAPPAPG